MTELDALTDWVATLIVASLTWVAGMSATLQPARPEADVAAQTASGVPVMLGWAQTTDEPDIQQVGEEPVTDSDVEELDSGAPPSDTATADATAGDATTVGPVEDEDVELLDQGSPPASAPAPAAADAVTTTDATTAAAPAPLVDTAATYTAPVSSVPAGPVLPEGFGEGSVHVSAGRGEFPPGLEECEVGVVTGRAFVGIDCGDDGDDVVGHAPTFEDFPFVLEDTFPFDPDSPLLTEQNFPFDENVGFFNASSETDSEDDSGNILVTAGGASGPSIGTTGGNSGSGVSLAQRARDGDADGSRTGGSKKRDRPSASGSDGGGDSSVAYQATKAKKDNSRNNASAEDGKNSKKDRAKANGEKKQKAKARNKDNDKHKNKGKDKKSRKKDRNRN